MKKLILSVLLVLTAFQVNAAQTTGKIQEIKLCSTGNTSGARWINTLQFKVNDQWYATWANFYASSDDSDNNVASSLVMMAFSQNLSVEVRGTSTWSSVFQKCGVASGAVVHDRGGDFIRISR